MEEKSKTYRTIFFYKNYFEDFYTNQRIKVRNKIIWTLKMIETRPIVPELYLKHIEGTNGLYEIRIQHSIDIFRIFCFFDKGQLVVLANAFHKKTKKTPEGEIEKALKIKKEYEHERK